MAKTDKDSLEKIAEGLAKNIESISKKEKRPRKASEKMEEYFAGLDAELNKIYDIAMHARKQGLDPDRIVEIRPAADVASRVEGLVGPAGVAELIRELEKGGKARDMVAKDVMIKILDGGLIQGDRQRLIDQGVRTAVSILTEGVLVAPTEGIASINIKSPESGDPNAGNPDGTSYLEVNYAGPIRSAGGTIAAYSVVMADIARRHFGIGEYRPTETELERYVEEINLYHDRCARLQFKPTDEQIKHIIRNCPVCISGEPTEQVEVSVYRNLPRMRTNRVRSGIALVSCEGIAQKSAKVLKYTNKVGIDWSFLEALAKGVKKTKTGSFELKEDNNFLNELVAGRPIFSYSMRPGGFRLRYGRNRCGGIAAKTIHPATMYILDSFAAIGTQLKLERPGKGSVCSPCDKIMGPVVKLDDGSVVHIKDSKQARELNPRVQEVLFLGDLLVSYGDFLKTNHPLIPSGIVEEWWEQIAKAKNIKYPKEMKAKDAFRISRENKIALHPEYTYFWQDIDPAKIKELAFWLKEGEIQSDWFGIKGLRIESAPAKRVAEELCVPHTVEKGTVVFDPEHAYSLLSSLGILDEKKKIIDLSRFEDVFDGSKTSLENICNLSNIQILNKAPVYIGTRMGRPEKARRREMSPSVHALYPVGYVNKNRSIVRTYSKLKSNEKREGRGVEVDVARLKCNSCGKINSTITCQYCGSDCKWLPVCGQCGRSSSLDKERCVVCNGRINLYDRRSVDLLKAVDDVKRRMHTPSLSEDVKGVQGMISKYKIPEILDKGFLRAKYNLSVFRDGTCRFDMTDMTLTHFTPKEIRVNPKRLVELGYEKDVEGKPLRDDKQVLALKVQDVILPVRGAEYFYNITKFIDEMLVEVYQMQPIYRLKKKEDLVGQLTIGMSPHTSAGVLSRIIGFTESNVGYAHPYFHCAKRRNCFSKKTMIPIFENGRWEIRELGELVESRLKNEKKDDFGTVYSEVDGLKTYAFDQKTKKFEIARITHVSRHPPQKLVELKTKSGRRISVTEDHPFPSRSGKVTANDLDEAIVPKKIKIDEKDVKEFVIADISEDVMVNVDRDIFIGKDRVKISKKHGLTYKALTNFIYRRTYPLDIARDYLSTKELRRCRISAKRDDVRLPYWISCDEDLLFLLGVYIAEGHARKGEGEKTNYQIGFAASDKRVKELYVKKIRKVFRIEPYVNEGSVTVCSRLVYEFFLSLGAGKNARDKAIPSFVFSLPKKKVRALLAGLFLGDGSVSHHSTLEVNLCSVSKRLIDGTSFLLMRQAIRHSYSQKEYEHPKHAILHKLRMYSDDAKEFIEKIGFWGEKQARAEKLLNIWKDKRRTQRFDRLGDAYYDKVISREQRGVEQVYSLTVEPHHTLIADGIVSHQCDGDEDCLMMLGDALLNFSRKFLPASRGGTMDAPLVLTTRLDPTEVDDEAHCMEIVDHYPLAFYEAAQRITPPYEVEIPTVKDVLNTEAQYEDLKYTHLESDIEDGPKKTAYVSIEKKMAKKVEAEFILEDKLRSVDAADAAKRVLLAHFLPDMYGNLRSFSRQTFRCSDCNTKYRRVPLVGKCTKCNGKLLQTIYKGGIEKYLKPSRELCTRYSLPKYMVQRLDLIQKDIDSIFVDEKKKQADLSDFM